MSESDQRASLACQIVDFVVKRFYNNGHVGGLSRNTHDFDAGTFSIMTLSRMTLSIMTLSIIVLDKELSAQCDSNDIFYAILVSLCFRQSCCRYH
jgi:hypothetical protein